MVVNITFLSFLLFSMCQSMHDAVNTWINCSFFYINYMHGPYGLLPRRLHFVLQFCPVINMTLAFPPTNDQHPNARNCIDSLTPKNASRITLFSSLLQISTVRCSMRQTQSTHTSSDNIAITRIPLQTIYSKQAGRGAV